MFRASVYHRKLNIRCSAHQYTTGSYTSDVPLINNSNSNYYFETKPCSVRSAVVHSQLIATFTSRVQEILLPQRPKQKISQAWWQVPVIPATQNAEAEESLEPGKRRLHTLGGQGRWIMRSEVRDQPDKHGTVVPSHIPKLCLFDAQDLAVWPGLECSGMIVVHCRLDHRGSKDTPTLPSQVGWTTEMRSHHIPHAGLELLHSSDPPASASQSTVAHACNPLLWEAEAGGSPKRFGSLRWVDHVRPGVQHQPGQHGDTPSLLKTQKLAEHNGTFL
ncbi:hypothetical protein AAY473_000801 [Plecturocebus cupreus]